MMRNLHLFDSGLIDGCGGGRRLCLHLINSLSDVLRGAVTGPSSQTSPPQLSQLLPECLHLNVLLL